MPEVLQKLVKRDRLEAATARLKIRALPDQRDHQDSRD